MNVTMKTPPTFYAIDSPWTSDRDDAIGCDGKDLFVAVADVKVRDEKVEALLRRPETSYLPTRHVPMLGKGVEQAATLREGNCMAFVVRVPQDGSACELVRARIKVQVLTYLEAAEWSIPELLPLRELALKERLQRYDFDKHVAMIEGVERKLSRHECNEGFVLVMEMMVLANQSIACHMLQNDIPGLYRNHPAGEGQRAFYGVNPTGHAGLRIPVYTHATSPLRRLVDLINWRQIRASLSGQAYLDVAPLCERINAYYAAQAEADSNQFKEWALEKAERRAENVDANQLARSKDFKNVVRVASTLDDKLREATLARASQKLLSAKEAALIMVRKGWMVKELAQKDLDFVSILHTAIQSGDMPEPEVSFTQLRFTCTMKAGKVEASGEGSSKMEAQQDASRNLLIALGEAKNDHD